MPTLLTFRYWHHYNETLTAYDAPKRFASEEALRNDRNDHRTRIPDEHNAGSCTPLDQIPPFLVE